MKHHLDRQDGRDPWPFPLDTPLDRARKVAGMYRSRLRALNTGACDEADHTATAFGETWMLDKPDIIDSDRELTTRQAAELVGVPPKRIREWACARHPDRPDTPLLPRFKMRGRERTYLARHVLEAAAVMRRSRHAYGRA